MNYKNYNCTLKNLKKTLDTYGVAVIPDILTNEECDQHINSLWKELGELTSNMDLPLKMNDKKTWKTLYELYPLHSMLIQHFGIGHLQTSWNVRQNKKISKVFSQIHKTKQNELLVSFDGISLHLPPEDTKKGWYRGTQWFHTDQSPLHTELCIQGMITLYDVNDNDATLAILEGSHKHHEAFFKTKQPSIKSDWYKLNKDFNELQYFVNKGCNPYCVKATKGSLILWNSKTFHQGIEPQKGRAHKNTRLVIYICMTPKSWATEAILKKKQKAFDEQRTTNHWPHRPKLFSLSPQTYGKALPNVNVLPKPKLSEHGKSLAGIV
jgi:hypothetical protein